MSFFDWLDLSNFGNVVYFYTTVMFLLAVFVTVYFWGKFSNIYEKLSLKRRFGLQRHNWGIYEIKGLDKGLKVGKFDLEKTFFEIGKGVHKKVYITDKNAINKYFKGVPIQEYVLDCPFPISSLTYQPDLNNKRTAKGVSINLKQKYNADGSIMKDENGQPILEEQQEDVIYEVGLMKPVKYIDLHSGEVASIMEMFLQWAIASALSFNKWVKTMLIVIAVGLIIAVLLEVWLLFDGSSLSSQMTSVISLAHSVANSTAIVI